MSCDKCVRKTYCPYIHHFNHDTSVGCVEFQDKKYVNTITTNTISSMSKCLECVG